MDNEKTIKIYGERNTNTNYLSKLVENNLKIVELRGKAPPKILTIQSKLPGREWFIDLYFDFVYRNTLGWKHTKVLSAEKLVNLKTANELTLFLTVTKNPYSWLLSLYKKPYHQYGPRKESFEKFLLANWKTVKREGTNRKAYMNPVHIWNDKNRAYLSLPKNKTMNITTEEVFEDPEKIINEIAKIYNVDRKSDTFIPHSTSTKNSGKTTKDYSEYYLKEKWRDEISDEAVGIINRYLDKNLMGHFGYKII